MRVKPTQNDIVSTENTPTNIEIQKRNVLDGKKETTSMDGIMANDVVRMTGRITSCTNILGFNPMRSRIRNILAMKTKALTRMYR